MPNRTEDALHEIFAHNVEAILTEAGMSRRELARRANISPMQVSRLLRVEGSLKLVEAENISKALLLDAIDCIMQTKLSRKQIRRISLPLKLKMEEFKASQKM